MKVYCQQKGYLEPGETQGAFLRVGCSAAQLKRFNKFFANSEYQAYCGSSTPGVMLEKAIAEATTEWSTQAEEQTESTAA